MWKDWTVFLFVCFLIVVQLNLVRLHHPEGTSEGNIQSCSALNYFLYRETSNGFNQNNYWCQKHG